MTGRLRLHCYRSHRPKKLVGSNPSAGIVGLNVVGGLACQSTCSEAGFCKLTVVPKIAKILPEIGSIFIVMNLDGM